MDKYSVLMSVYVKEKPEYLAKSIDSMVNQTIAPDEFIIVKDGPLTPELDAVIDKYARRKELFTIISLEKNGGLGRALNHGIKASRNELIARMDSDDISKPERCELQLKAFEEDSELAACGTQIDEFIDSIDNVVSARIVPCTFEDIKTFSKIRSPFNHPTVMYKKSVLEKLKGYAEYGRKEDLDLFVRLVLEGNKAINLEEHCLWYRTNADNLQRRRTWQNCSEYISIMFGFYKKRYIGLSDIAYVLFGQLAMYLLPTAIVKNLSGALLRKKV